VANARLGPDVYKPLASRCYDFLKPASQAADEIAFYAAFAARSPGPVLEPMCGSGRILIPLLEVGFAIEGFDASESMLAALKLRCPQASVWCERLESFQSPRLYGLIIIPFGSFGLVLEAAVRQAALENLYRHLLPGGAFVFEVDTIHSELPDTPMTGSTEFEEAEGAVLSLATATCFHSATQRFVAHSTYQARSSLGIIEQEEEAFEQHLFTINELDGPLMEAGFSLVRKYQDYSCAPAQAGCHKIIYHCQR